LLTSIAYDYIQDNDYCASIPWFKEYVDSMTSMSQVMEDPKNRAAVIGTAQNLAICYNNCKEYDSAYSVFRRILSFDPQDVDALTGVARFQQQSGRKAGDSARAMRDAGNEAASKELQGIRDQRFDSARVVLQQAFTLRNDKCDLAAEYGLMAAILQRYDEAKAAFSRAAELCPTTLSIGFLW